MEWDGLIKEPKMRKLKLEELGRLDPEAFKQTEKWPLVLVLDNIRSMHNVGSAFRTADAFALEKVVLCGITAQPPHREIHKTALGATESVDWQYYADVQEAANALQAEGYELLLIEQTTHSQMLHAFKPTNGKKYALVFGNEVDGVSDKLVSAGHTCLEIPQHGTKHSLNVAVCMGIVIWDFYGKK
jgi:23S rRNA (guanosine2251-2'-O)-methyltransferase